VTSSLDWYLDAVVHLERSGRLSVHHDVVRATSDLDADCFMRHLQGGCHLRSPLSVGRVLDLQPTWQHEPVVGADIIDWQANLVNIEAFQP
jgi:hypothetical protein